MFDGLDLSSRGSSLSLGPIFLGRKGTLLDMSGYYERCRATLGYIPNAKKRLTPHELKALGYTKAAEGLNAFHR